MKRLLLVVLVLMLSLSCIPAIAERLTDEDVTFTVSMKFNDNIRDPMHSKVWDWIYEETGIRFIPQELTDGEKAGLMFSTAEFPDFIGAYGCSAGRIRNAARDGFLMDIGELVEEYSPTWQSIFEKNSILYHSAMVDGKLYSLPYQIGGGGVRDKWCINKTWLDEVGLPMPTTMDELLDACVAVKNAAGTGTIPENVIPYYLCWENKVGGPFDIYGAYGMLFGFNDFGLTAKADGTLEYNFINPEIKEGLKWIQKAVQLGVLPVDCFNFSWNDYLNYVSAEPSVVFCYTASGIQNTTCGDYVYMDVPDNGIGRTAFIRRTSGQAGNPLYAGAIAKNENTTAHRELIGKFLEWAAQPEVAMRFYWGMLGTTWDYNEEGKAYMLFGNGDTELVQKNYTELGFNNRWFCYLGQDWLDENYYDPNESDVTSMAWANKNIYGDNLPSWDPNVYLATLSEDEELEKNDLYAEINSVRKLTMATWFTTDADIEAEWDGYVEEMEELGVYDWLELCQKAHNKSLGIE